MEQLIRDLNAPRNQGRPEAINSIQRQLQRLQRDQSAWQNGLDLLNSSDQLLQFYGALTIGMKINADWEIDNIGQNRTQAAQLLESLITAYVRLSSVSDSDVVISKLSSTLATLCAKPDAAWAHPCRHVFSCILAGRYIPEIQSLNIADMLDSAGSISGFALKAVLRLAAALQEELDPGGKDKIGHRSEAQLSNNATDVWQLLDFAISEYSFQEGLLARTSTNMGLQVQTSSTLFTKTFAEALQQLPAWTSFVAEESSPPHLLARLFRESVQRVIFLLAQPSTAEYCMPCLTSLQNEHHRSLAKSIPDYRSQISNSNAVSRWVAEMREGNFSPEASSYVDFLEAVTSQLDCTTDAYLTDLENVAILERVQALTRCRGAAMVEDEVCQTILEIMTTIAEGYSDWSEPSNFDDSMTTLIRDVCLATLAKVQYPSNELDKASASWDEDDYTRFEDYRFQAKDFFETSFGILGPALATDVALVASQLDASSWSEFEATLFLLTSVSDALSNDSQQCDPALNQVFSSPPWMHAVDPSNQVPSRVRRAIIRLLAETTSYLQRNPQNLISSLNFLFRSLQVKNHSNQAARAIHNLCDNQRLFLVQALPQFLETITTLENISLHSRCRVLSGVAALVQALPTDAAQMEPLQKMLQLIRDLESKTADTTTTQEDEVLNPLFDRLSMLAAVAKGLQSPSDTPIDLESSEKNNNTFWIEGPGKQTQQTVLQLLSEPWNQLLRPESGDLVAAACDLLRAGFKEDHPCLFKFSSSASVELLCNLIDLQNPNLDQTMNTTSCYVSSSATPSATNSSEADALLARVLNITTQAIDILRNSSPPPHFSAPTSILDFLIRSFPRYGAHIFTHPSSAAITAPIFEFAVLLLQSTTDTLPRRSAAAFFVSFLDYTDPASCKLVQDPQSSANIISILDKYSPIALALTLHLLGGECARSEIESLSALLRTFIAKQPLRAKRILSEAIQPESGVLTQKALDATKPEQRSRFVAQIEMLRGGRKTNEIAREFWITCRGGQFGYVT